MKYFYYEVFFFYSYLHLSTYVLYITPPPFPLSSFLSFPFLSRQTSLPPPLKNVTAAILSYVVSHLLEGTENLRKTCVDTVGHLAVRLRSTVLEIWHPALPFDLHAADRRSPIQVLTQREVAWIEWPPSIWHLSHTKRCWLFILVYIYYFLYFISVFFIFFS